MAFPCDIGKKEAIESYCFYNNQYHICYAIFDPSFFVSVQVSYKLIAGLCSVNASNVLASGLIVAHGSALPYNKQVEFDR
jgi:hypothetical protein